MANPPSPRHSHYHLRRRVHFYEVDSVGIVHFSTFARYLEEAEHALWRAAGLSIAPLGSDIGFPRVAMSFEFRSPLRFEDEFDIDIRIVKIGRTSIGYACTMACGGRDVAEGTLTIVCVRRGADGAMQATPIPEEIAGRFEVASGGA